MSTNYKGIFSFLEKKRLFWGGYRAWDLIFFSKSLMKLIILSHISSVYFTFKVDRRLCFPCRVIVSLGWWWWWCGNIRQKNFPLIFVSQDDIEDFVLSMSMRLVTVFSAETTSTIFGGKINVSFEFKVFNPKTLV